jgi:cytochrome c oxidase subunit 1
MTGPGVQPGADHEAQSFWRRYVFSVDHKMIGRQYLFLGLFMALVGGFTA